MLYIGMMCFWKFFPRWASTVSELPPLGLLPWTWSAMVPTPVGTTQLPPILTQNLMVHDPGLFPGRLYPGVEPHALPLPQAVPTRLNPWSWRNLGFPSIFCRLSVCLSCLSAEIVLTFVCCPTNYMFCHITTREWLIWFYEIWNAFYAVRGCSVFVHLNFLQLVIPTWQILEGVMWEEDPLPRCHYSVICLWS